MPTPKDIGQYPAWFFNILSKFQGGQKSQVKVYSASRGKAIRTRQLFYSFRQLLSGDLRAAANRIKIELHGTDLMFVDQDLDEPQIEVIQTVIDENLNIPIAPVQSERLHAALRQDPDRKRYDPAEALAEQWLKGDAAKAPDGDQKLEAHICHEWDVYDVCVECHKPKEVQ